MATLIYENTAYSLLLYFLYDDEWKKKDYLIYGNRLEPTIIENLSYYTNKVNFLESSLIDIKKQPLKFYLVRLNELIKYRKYNKVIGNVNCFHNPFKKLHRTVIEDGLGSYFELLNLSENILPINKRAVWELKQPLNYQGPEEYILSGSFDIPRFLTQKINLVDIQARWSFKSLEQKEEILDIFNVSKEVLEKASHKKNILLTQCFSEDGVISELDKINGYLALIKSLDIKHNDLIIKTHPRETTDYSTYFPEAVIINEKLPFELLVLMGVKYETVITLTSSSVFSLNYDFNCFFMGTSYLFNWNTNLTQKVEPNIQVIDNEKYKNINNHARLQR